MNPPLLTSRGSALGLPSAVTSQPTGVGRFSLALLRILPAATVVVAMSSRNGSPGFPGAAKAMGSVPKRARAPWGGATWNPLAARVTLPSAPASRALTVQDTQG